MKCIIIFGILIVLVLVGLIWIQGIIPSKTTETVSVDIDMGSASASGFMRADGSHVWEFPDDYGPHPDYQTEWWYYTGNLKSEDGRRFGYQLTFFRRGLSPYDEQVERESQWAGNQVYIFSLCAFLLSFFDDKTGSNSEKEEPLV